MFTEVVLLVVIGTTIWVGFDAHARGHGVVGWVVGCLLLWIVVFPAYLVKRKSAPSAAPAPRSLAPQRVDPNMYNRMKGK